MSILAIYALVSGCVSGVISGFTTYFYFTERPHNAIDNAVPAVMFGCLGLALVYAALFLV